jgi:hypothetical protein
MSPLLRSRSRRATTAVLLAAAGCSSSSPSSPADSSTEPSPIGQGGASGAGVGGRTEASSVGTGGVTSSGGASVSSGQALQRLQGSRELGVRNIAR